jgi:two-component system chemotaxis response regulator CheY
MPGLSGLELCRKIRAYPPSIYSYFIMITGHATLEDIEEGMSAGADDYLIKPLDPDDLRARLIAAERVTTMYRQLAGQRAELEGSNRMLSDLARRDPLTGLGNRRALQEDLEHLEARVSRYAHSYCMAIVDVDHFKSYNDAYGHQAGDSVLRSVANELSAQARSGDAVYRYGGDEFLCIFPEQSTPSGAVAVERMRVGIERLAIPHVGNSLGVVTVSAGLAVLDSARAGSATDLLSEADRALYQAKLLGRNRVEHVAYSTP